MKRIHSIHILTTGLFVLWSLTSLYLRAQDGYIHGDLKPGSYQVGFKVFHEYDASRTFKAEITEDGVLSSKPAPRPMQIAVWYPSQENDHIQYMAYRDYYHLDATVEDPSVHVTEALKKQMDQNFVNQPIFTGPSNPEKLKSFLELPTKAIYEAEAREGSFPLIIYAPREYRGVYYNTQLIEYLVSHGFIVAVTPNKDLMSATVQSPPSTEVLMTHVNDLRFVKGFMSQFPYVDMSRVGLIGWSWGAMPALALADADPNISAVVSLDGNIRFAGQQSLLTNVPGFSTADFSTPFMHVQTGGGWLNNIDYSFYDQVKFADAYHVTFKDAQWFAASTYFYLVHGKGMANPEQFDFELMDKAHDGMVEYTLQFFSAYLQHNNHAKQWLNENTSHQGFAEDTVLKKQKDGSILPPSASIFSSLFINNGSDAAIKVWNRVKHDNPEYQIANAGDLNALGYALISQGRAQDAIIAFKLQVEEYPELPNAWDSMGEGYKNNGDDQLAIEAFKKSLSLNPPEFVKANSINLLGELGVKYEGPDSYSLSPKEAKRLEGAYTYSVNGQQVTSSIKWQEGKLIGQTEGQPDIELLPRSADTFWAFQNEQALGMTLSFNIEGSGPVNELIMITPQGQKLTAVRV